MGFSGVRYRSQLRGSGGVAPPSLTHDGFPNATNDGLLYPRRPLAVNASRERSNGQPDTSERIEELLVTAQELWRAGTEVEEDDERKTAFRAAIQLVNLADMVALTTRA